MIGSRRSSLTTPSNRNEKHQHDFLGQHHLGEEDASKLPRPVACESDGERSAVRHNRVIGIRLGVVLSDLRSQSRISCRDFKVEAQAFRTKHKKYINHHNNIMNNILKTPDPKRPSTAPPRKSMLHIGTIKSGPSNRQPELSRPSTVMFSNKRSVYMSDSDSNDSDSVTEDSNSCSGDSQSQTGTESSVNTKKDTLQRNIRCHSHHVTRKRSEDSDDMSERRAKSAGAFLESLMSADASSRSSKRNQRCFYALDTTRGDMAYKPGSVLIFDRAKTARAVRTQLRYDAKQRSLYKPPPKFDFETAIKNEKEKFSSVSQDVKVFTDHLDKMRKISLYRKNYLSRYLTDDELW